jgi:hypothetical protein
LEDNRGPDTSSTCFAARCRTARSGSLEAGDAEHALTDNASEVRASGVLLSEHWITDASHPLATEVLKHHDVIAGFEPHGMRETACRTMSAKVAKAPP